MLMLSSEGEGRVELDAIDRAVVDALTEDGRVPLRTVAEILGVSPQTVARRYRRLREEAGLRVVGLVQPGPAGHAQWLLRVTVAPQVARDLTRALAARRDTSRVSVTSGGSEIVALIETEAVGSQYPLFLRELPATTGVIAVDAHRILHVYRGGPSVWLGRSGGLSADQRVRLARPVGGGGTGTVLEAADRAMLAELARDGRTTATDLATRTGRSAATTARRLDELRAAGVLFFEVDIDPVHFGAPVQTLLWMSTPPAGLDDVATTLAAHREPAFVASLTGSSNLVANLLTTDTDDLHRYLTEELGALPEITRLETTPVLRTVKASS